MVDQSQEPFSGPALPLVMARLSMLLAEREEDHATTVTMLATVIRMLTKLRDLQEFLTDMPIRERGLRDYLAKEIRLGNRSGDLLGYAAIAASLKLSDKVLDIVEERAHDLWDWSLRFALSLGAVPPDVERTVIVGLAQAQISDLVAIALDGLSKLSALRKTPETPEAENRSTLRARRLRARRRFGAVHQVQVNLYTGDIALLRHFGFLGAGGTKADATAALETFLLASFLAHSDPSLPWDERMKLQRKGRIAAMLPRKPRQQD